MLENTHSSEKYIPILKIAIAFIAPRLNSYIIAENTLGKSTYFVHIIHKKIERTLKWY